MSVRRNGSEINIDGVHGNILLCVLLLAAFGAGCLIGYTGRML
jgi:hypothetical protein